MPVTFLNDSIMKRIAVLSSGSDNSGINGAIRAIVRSSASRGLQCFGVNWGFRGLFDDNIQILTSRDVSGKIGKAGCFLGTARPEKTLANDQMQIILRNLNRKSITGVIVIGGGGSLALSQKLSSQGIPVIGIPSTIQDDIAGTETCLGVDSALNNIMQSIDHIRSCDSSRNRSFLVQVEGRESGSLALKAAIVTGCEMCLVPEHKTTDLLAIVKRMADANMKGKTQCITLISSGWEPGIDALSKVLEEREHETDLAVRKTILGYVQRGGSPTAADRLLGTNLGVAAVDLLCDKMTNHIVGVKDSKIIAVPFEAFIGKKKPLDEEYLRLFDFTNS
jgi:6-phosphofructokinase 1